MDTTRAAGAAAVVVEHGRTLTDVAHDVLERARRSQAEDS